MTTVPYYDPTTIDGWLDAYQSLLGFIIGLLIIALFCLVIASGIYYGGTALLNKYKHNDDTGAPQ